MYRHVVCELSVTILASMVCEEYVVVYFLCACIEVLQFPFVAKQRPIEG